MEWTTAASLAARAGKQAYDNRHLIQKYWTRLKVYLDRGDTQVVITGHAGAGKTLLASQIHGRARDLGYELPKESRTVEVETLEVSQWARLVRVLPGQDGFRSKGAVEAFVQSKTLEGVIHVVDFGFVAPRDSVIVASMIKQDGIETVDQLRKNNFRFELEQLRVLLTDVRRSLDAHGSPKWMLIAVNKVDLFADRREEALEYYHPAGSSEFSKVLRDFQSSVGADNLPIYVVQSSAYEVDFEWNGHKVRSLLERQEQNAILLEFTRSLAAIVEGHP